MLKRFIFGGQDSITNPNPNIIRLSKNHESESEYSGFGGKDSNPNPNPNICYNTVLCSKSKNGEFNSGREHLKDNINRSTVPCQVLAWPHATGHNHLPPHLDGAGSPVNMRNIIS